MSETILDDELFAKLAERYGLALLSNTDPIHVAYLESHFSFFRHFPARIYSCRVGVCKPDAAIYRRAAAAAGVRADEILYIDDIAEYIEAGRRAGMDVHLFRSAESLKEDLRNRGLLGG